MPLLAPENLTVATTGASGSLFLKHFLLTVERDPREKTVTIVAKPGKGKRQKAASAGPANKHAAPKVQPRRKP